MDTAVDRAQINEGKQGGVPCFKKNKNSGS